MVRYVAAVGAIAVEVGDDRHRRGARAGTDPWPATVISATPFAAIA